MGNSHVRKKTKNYKKKKGFLDRISLYPDYGTDAEGYEFSVLKLVIMALGIAVLITATSLADRMDSLPNIAMCGAAFICCGFFCISNLVSCISRGRILCEALPVVVGCVCAFAAGEYRLASFSVLVYEAAKLFESWIDKRQHAKADSILDILPGYANVVLPRNETVRRKPNHLREGDVVMVGENEIIPIDGVVIDGRSAVDYMPLTGEKSSEIVAKGSSVLSGGINRENRILVQAECDYNESTVKRIFNSFSSAVSYQPEYSARASSYYNILYPVLFAIAVVFAAVVPAFTHEWIQGLKKASVILLCACPLGIINSLDLYSFSAVSKVFASGAVIRDGRLLNRLSRIESFACNKTGTVTHGIYSVTEVMPYGYSRDDPADPEGPETARLLDVAVKAESVSSHPIAAALRKYCGVPDNITVPGLIAEELPGLGISAFLGADSIYCGNAALLYEHGINCMIPETPGTAIHIAYNNRYLGYIILRDDLRQGNYDALEKMRACGVKNFSLLSCDLRSVVRPIAASENFTNVKAELTPEKKIRAVEYLMGTKPQGRMLVFLGNGSDETACGEKADIFAASGVLKNKQAWDASDVAVFQEGITVFPAVISAACTCMQFSMAAFAVNFASRAVMLVLAMLGIVSLPVAAVIFAVISVVSNVFCSKIE